MQAQWQWSQALYHSLNMIVAFVLALPIAFDREYSRHNLGFRTFPIVAVASCGFVMIGTSIVSPEADGAHARLLQGLITGVGFLGGGVILKQGESVKGMATAASIWSTAIMGAAAGFERYEIAALSRSSL